MRFYVYKLMVGEEIVYIGKGSGSRLKAQCRSFNCEGEIVESFASERAAYAAEIEYIAAHRPRLNRHPGGNGSRAHPSNRPRKLQWERGIEAIGTRHYAARLLLACERSRPGILSSSKIDVIRQVAYGERA